MTFFSPKDTVKFSLKIKGEGQEIAISCGNIQTVDLNLFSYGFEGTIAFWADDKNSQSLFDTSQIFQVILDISPSFFRTENPSSLSLKGIVVEKTLVREEVHSKVKEMPIFMRLFSLRFKDAAQVVWNQHFPTALYTQKTMQEMIDFQKTPDISLEYEWEKLKQKHPIIALGLGCEENQASFYSFLMHYLLQNQGILEYNYSTHSYTLLGKKREGEASEFLFEQVHSILCHFPENQRHFVQVMNGYTENPQTKKAEISPAYRTVHRDFLLNTAQTSHFEKVAKETQPLLTSLQHTLQVVFKELPSFQFFPGAIVSFKNCLWSPHLYYKEKIYRVCTLRLQAEADTLDYLESNTRTEQVYNLQAEMTLELKNETGISLPVLVPPIYPFYIEGKVVSEVGEKEQTTFQMNKDDENSLEDYKVEIPLWDNQKVIVPFQPHFSSQFYFPFCKGERVLVALHLFSARIDRSLEWWPRSRLPADQQGNQIVFSPKKETTYTFIQHMSEGDSTLLKIERQTPKDVQKVEMKEQGIRVEIKDQDKSDPKCFIELDQQGGITLTSQDKEKSILQTIRLETGKVQIICQNEENKTSILQEPQQITIDCKNFFVNSEHIKVTAKEDSQYQIGKKFLVESGENIGFKAKKEISSESSTMQVVGENSLNLKSNSVIINGSKDVKISGNQSSLQGAKIDITSSGITDISCKLINIKGKMTNIEGSIIKMN